MKTINAVELKLWMDEGRDFTLVDVREDFEREYYNIGGIHIPMGEILERRKEIPAEKDAVLYCEKGIRSSIVIQRLEGMGFDNLYNLSGGMKAWKETML